ncbi:MAG: hemolysin family protein, partial [Verrucomicrobiota bacterium]
INISPYSRFPVYHETSDHILGIVHIKDLHNRVRQDESAMPITRLLKEVPFVPESMPINDLLKMLRAEQTQMAVVVDEYGGTAGLVTMEDIIEELVGDIQDEHDNEETMVQRLSDDSFVLDAKMPVDEINQLLSLDIPESEEYESVGGYLFQELGRIPRPGEILEKELYSITITQANSHQLQKVRIQKHEVAAS